MDNLKGALVVMDTIKVKPNFSELARTYGKDRRTIKRYHEGYQGKPTIKNKSSKLDPYKEEIREKINYVGATIKGTFKYFEKKYKNIGTYSNFKQYVHNKELIDKKEKKAHPRFETEKGEQLQFDWIEDLKMISKYGEVFEFNLFSATLSYSRMHIYIYSINRTREDVQRCLIEVFKYIGGIPQHLLTDNMSSVVNTATLTINHEFKQFVKDMETDIITCDPKSPETKGKVESANRFKSWIIPYNYEFSDEPELINIIKEFTEDVNKNPHETLKVPPLMLFNTEKNYLKPLPKSSVIHSYLNKTRNITVNNGGLVKYRGVEYSVDIKYIGCNIDIQQIDNIIRFYYKDKLIQVININKCNDYINYTQEDYIKAFKSSLGNKSECVDVDSMAKKNLETIHNFAKEVENVQQTIE